MYFLYFFRLNKAGKSECHNENGDSINKKGENHNKKGEKHNKVG